MSTILVTGSADGLGEQIASALRLGGHTVVDYDYAMFPEDDVRDPPPIGIFRERMPLGLDVLVNCAGVNDIDWLENFTEDRWDRVMDTNAKSIFLMTQALLPLLLESEHGVIVNIVSNAAHVPMTNSLAYNASKAAAHIMTKQLAREFRGKLTVFGIAPNKLAGTGMSHYIDSRVPAMRGWTEEQAKAYQLQSLPAGAETPPMVVAEFLQYLLSDPERNRYLTGCVIPYGV